MLTTLAGKFMDWLHRRYTIRRLEALDDWLLADLGATRENLSSFVDGISCARTKNGPLPQERPVLAPLVEAVKVG